MGSVDGVEAPGSDTKRKKGGGCGCGLLAVFGILAAPFVAMFILFLPNFILAVKGTEIPL